MKAFKNKNFLIGFVFVVILVMITLISLFYTPYPPTQINSNAQMLPPSSEHLGGTDRLGRDMLSRTMAAGQTAFSIGIISISNAMITGVLLGLIAGYFQGLIGSVIMRFTDAFKSIPGLLFAMMISAVFGKSFISTTVAITIILIPSFIRITRANVLKIKSIEYIQWTSLLGLNPFRVMIIHILPNIISSIIITASMGFADAVLIEASLSYLGLGIQPPDPSWGQMLNEGQGFIITAPWLVLLPGTMITLLVLGFNLLGDGLSDLLDAKSSNREA